MGTGLETAPPQPAEAYAARHLRRNTVLLIGEATAFLAGSACLDSTTVLPVLFRQLGASDQVLGFIRFISVVGFALPAVLASHRIHGRQTHLPFLLWATGIGRLLLLTVPFTLLLFGATRPAWAFAIILAAMALFWALDGLGAVSWYDIVAKAIPARVRGRFFGVMQTLTGLAALGAGVAVAHLLDSRSLPFPSNFAVLAGIAGAAAAVSFVGLALVREPRGRTEDAAPRPGIVGYLRAAPALLRRYPIVYQLIVTRLLLDGVGVAAPFYVIFARERLGVGLGTVGLYLAVQSAGRVLGGLAWGWVSDRFGTAAGMRAVAVAILCVPVLALAASQGAPWLLAGVFFLLGTVMDGLWMVTYNALLGGVPDADRPMAVGVATLWQTPAALYGLLGGVLAQHLSYGVVFAVAALFAAAGVWSSMRIGRAHPAAPMGA